MQQGESQAELLSIPEQPEVVERPVTAPARLRTIDRNQSMLAQIWVDELIGADHKAGAIWELTGRINLSRFGAMQKAREGGAGRAAWDPRLLVSVWVYAYSEGISAAREVERLMAWEPGLQWLCGLETVNHHTLSDFRVEHGAALSDLFTQLLGMLEAAGLLSLERVAHDGTKIQAQAGADSFRRAKSLREHLERARQVVESMGDPKAEAASRERRQAAQHRAARERCERLDQAMQEWEQRTKKSREEEKEQERVSMTEPEARLMKHGNHAIVPSYNAQITTEAQNKIIVGSHLSQSSSDAQSLMPALQEVERNTGRVPGQVVVDGGFTNRSNIVACAEKEIDLVGSLPDAVERSEAAMKALGIAPEFAPHHFKILEEGRQLQCPAGCILHYVRQSRKRQDMYHKYQAEASDCQACVQRTRCCAAQAEQGRTVSIRVEERAEVVAFRRKMEQPEQRAAYKQRAPVAEFPNAWIKEKLGLRKFRLRGLRKAATELTWACLTYNVMQWMRLSWLKALHSAA